jgi:hypothetical protein
MPPSAFISIPADVEAPGSVRSQSGRRGCTMGGYQGHTTEGRSGNHCCTVRRVRRCRHGGGCWGHTIRGLRGCCCHEGRRGCAVVGHRDNRIEAHRSGSKTAQYVAPRPRSPAGNFCRGGHDGSRRNQGLTLHATGEEMQSHHRIHLPPGRNRHRSLHLRNRRPGLPPAP